MKLPRVLSHRVGRSLGLRPIITWCHYFFHSNQYFAHEKQFKVWIESNRSLRCHVTTLSLRQVSQSPPPPVTKMRVPVFFAGDCEIELRQTGVICYPRRQRSWSCRVFTGWILDARCPFQWKWQVLHNYDISVLQQVGMFFDGIACLMNVWPLFKRSSGSSLVSRWRDAPLVHARISNVTSQMKTNRSALISGASNAFLENVINYIVKIARDI